MTQSRLKYKGVICLACLVLYNIATPPLGCPFISPSLVSLVEVPIP